MNFYKYLIFQVFPTKQQKWVSLEDQPMIADKLEWEKMFGGKKGVHFLDLEDRSKPHHGRSTQRRILTRRKLANHSIFIFISTNKVSRTFEQMLYPIHVLLRRSLCGVVDKPLAL